MKKSKIVGLGHYVPDNVVTNDDLSKMMDTNDAWITERTGIKERRWAVSAEDTTSGMGLKAARMALKNANMEASDLDFIVFATLSPDYYFPGPGVQIQEALGVDTIGALDVRNQCSGFVYALSVADQFIKTGMYKNILVIGSELHSGGLEKSTRGRGVTVIFGDGAGAAVLTASDDDHGILSTHLHSEGAYAKELALIGPATTRWVPDIIADNDPEDTSYYPYMNGSFVFKHAVTRFHRLFKRLWSKMDISLRI
jgi:3-oxoacyl-[acyl-carrier-protein] synthase-3